jgi:formiminoglutamase
MDTFFDHYTPGDKNHWKGRGDGKKDLRWHQKVQAIDLKTASKDTLYGNIVLLGFASDEGVRRNKGRVGAHEGPASLRKALSNLSWNWPSNYELFDAGDVVCKAEEMEAAQEGLSTAIQMIFDKGGFPFILGGGHETAFGSYSGLRQAFEADVSIGILNIDAHFDLRFPANGPNSGTPFYQIAALCEKNNQPFNYCCIGINPASNTQSLFEAAQNFEVSFITTDEMAFLPMERCLEKVRNFIDQSQLIYLTIDLDAFDSAFAPGVSAPAATGLSPAMILPVLKTIVQSEKLALVDICELNPQYDQDNRTAKLGANLLFRIVDAIMNKS